MPLQKIDVLVAHPDHPDDTDHGTTVRITVLHRDRLVAEERCSEFGILPEQQGLMTTLIIWNALRRMGVHNQDFMGFRDRILDTDAVQDEPQPAPGEAAGADPTQQGRPTGSPSPSASTGPESTGSTPSAPSPASTPTA